MPPRSAVTRVVLVALLVLAATGCGNGDDAGESRLPPVELVALEDGSALLLDEPADAPRVINLWATWCAPCRTELPHFDEVAQQAGPSIAMLGVNVGEGTSTAAALVEELGLRFSQSVNPAGDITSELEVTGLPATVFATADGEILQVHGGVLDDDQLRDRIDELFGVTIDA